MNIACRCRCWFLKLLWTARRSNQSVLEEINPEYYWKDWCWSWNSNTLATWGHEKGVTEDETDGWHHQHNGHEFEQTPGDGEGQGSLVYCSSWGHKESDMTDWLNNNNVYLGFHFFPECVIIFSVKILHEFNRQVLYFLGKNCKWYYVFLINFWPPLLISSLLPAPGRVLLNYRMYIPRRIPLTEANQILL